MKYIIGFMKKQPLLTAIIAVVIGVASVKLIHTEGPLAGGMLRMLLSMSMGFFLYLISGEKTLNHCGESTGYVIKIMMGFIVFSGIFSILGLIGHISDGETVQPGWPLQLLLYGFEVLFIGLFEEVAFRAVLHDGLIYQFPNSRSAFIASALVSSLVFGFVHVIGADVSKPLLLAQAVMKTITCGILGLSLLFLYWKTRNIWGCALVHALFDFLPILPMIFFGGELPQGYVMDGTLGIGVLAVYIIEAVITGAIASAIWKKVVRPMNLDELARTWCLMDETDPADAQ